MVDKDFDQMLQKIIAEEKLPFNEHSWEVMLKKLDSDKRNDRRVIMFFPIVLKTWASAACMAALLFSGLWHIFSSPELPKQSLHVKSSEAHFAPLKEKFSDTLFRNNIATVALPVNNKRASNINKEHIQTISGAIVESETVIQQNNDADTEVIVNALPKLPKYNYELPAVYEIEPGKQDRRVNISLNGGIAVQNRSGVTAGFIIRGRLTNRISVETNVNYIHGQQNVPIKQERTIIVTPPDIIGTDTSMQPQLPYSYTETWYESHKHTLSYLQLAPAVNIKLHKKISSSLGVDMQKILMNKDGLDMINKHLASAYKKIPEVDPGVIINLNYAITQRIGCGITYRESMLNVSKPKVAFINRDYLLFQLQYTIVK